MKIELYIIIMCDLFLKLGCGHLFSKSVLRIKILQILHSPFFKNLALIPLNSTCSPANFYQPKLLLLILFFQFYSLLLTMLVPFFGLNLHLYRGNFDNSAAFYLYFALKLV